jgi:hypothetical protein
VDAATALRKLQAEVRSKQPDDGPSMRMGAIPPDVATDEATTMTVGPRVKATLQDAVRALAADPRFEHLDDQTDAEVWNFACRCALKRGEDQVRAFVETHAKTPEPRVGLFGIAYLEITEPFSVGEVEFLPLPDEASEDGAFLRRDADCRSMAQVTVTGTNLDRMTERARDRVQHALRVLRISLAKPPSLVGSQLRFRLAETWVFQDALHAWQRHDGAPITLELPRPPSEIWDGFQFLELPYDNQNKAQRQAALALEWIDEARLAVNPLHKVLFLFSALEAILGDKSEGLKAPMIVFYRVLLGDVVSGGFSHPGPVYDLYDKVRSYAVHGEYPPVISENVASRLEWNVRDALYEFLKFSAERNLTTRAKVKEALLATDVAPKGLEWLKANDPIGPWETWSPHERPDPKKRERELEAELGALRAETEAERRVMATALGLAPATEAEEAPGANVLVEAINRLVSEARTDGHDRRSSGALFTD